MKLYSNSIADIVKSVEGKKRLVECRPYKFSDLAVKKLKPETSIDGDIVSYSLKDGGSFVDSTPVEDIFEKMSSEMTSDSVDFFRNHELHRASDVKYSMHGSYSKDDLPLSQTIYQRVLNKPQISNIYFPDRDLSYDSQVVLKHADFQDYIIPASFTPRLEPKSEIIKEYSDEATHLWENGMPVSEIKKLINKSLLQRSATKVITKPSVDLFKFLGKYPDERSIAVRKTTDGVESLDKAAMHYYDVFSRFFQDRNVVKKVLKECSSKDGTVNKKLCDIALLTRRKTAQGILEDRPSMYLYCDKKLPWRDCDSKLISELKQEDEFTDVRFELVKDLIKEQRKTVDSVLENINSQNLLMATKETVDEAASSSK